MSYVLWSGLEVVPGHIKRDPNAPLDLEQRIGKELSDRKAYEETIEPAVLTEALNAVIRDPKALDQFDWAKMSLSNDAQAIHAKPPAERSQAESERLNRLVIEKTFPGAIRQLHGDGWRPTLMLYGLLGVGVGGLFWVVARDWPRNHPWANAEEVALIEAGQSQESQTAGTDAIPWRELIASRNQWWFSASNFFANVGWVFLITLMPRFLAERFAVPVEQRGLMTTVPLFVASFGLIAGGWYTDRLSRTLGKRLGRAIPMGAFKLPCAAVLAISTMLPDPWTVTIALAIMSLCQDFGLPAVWAFAQDTGGKQAATVLGWGNMWGNLGAGVGPVMVGAIASYHGWDAALYTGALAFVMCAITGMMTNAAEPLFRSDEAES
jgi:nitrate/nitrite transporter NarK